MKHHLPNPRPAMTFPELMIGMVITSMVLLSLFTFTQAVATNWKASELSQTLTVAALRAPTILTQEVQDAREIGVQFIGPTDDIEPQTVSAVVQQELVRCEPQTTYCGCPATLLYWMGDRPGVTPDNRIQLSELRLLVHDPAKAVLLCYQAKLPDGAADPTYSRDAFCDPWTPSRFIATPHVFPRVVLGSQWENLKSKPLADSNIYVVAANFRLNDTQRGQRPGISVKLRLSVANAMRDVSASVVLRAPKTADDHDDHMDE